MFRNKAFSLLKLIPLMSGQSNVAYKFIHPAIASPGHRCHRSVEHRQRYTMCPDSAGGRPISAPQTKVMAEEELPGVLILDIGGTHGVLENLAALLKKHFHLITMKEFLENKKEMSKKIQSVFVFECRPAIDRELLESLPNLKVIGNSGVGVDHLDLKMISNFGVKVTNTPHAVADSTADIGMTLMLASARRLVEGAVIDQDALVEALRNKVIRAAALDVTYPEPLPRDHPLLKLNNIIISPHIGTATVQAIHMMAEEAIANMLAVLNGQPIPSEVFPK
ncbi:glyoxylate reductase/hydroxypyruvate reductase-like isoform X3 [Nyctibius grandis]|uniref:glyoxylate reductase/hydroxypyruvate reductase-like isoform X3 n=1 Tax=Nyctibius grandis TaxID=48427 RepID=UPI0035BC3D22